MVALGLSDIPKHEFVASEIFQQLHWPLYRSFVL